MRIIASLLVLLGLVALAAGLAAEWQKSASEGVTTPLFARSRDEDLLTVIAWTDTNVVVGADAITANVIFINRSDKAIRNIGVDQALAPQLAVSPHQIIVGDLQPHQRSRMFVLRGRPRAPSQQNIAITYHWTDAAGPGFGTLLLGPVFFHDARPKNHYANRHAHHRIVQRPRLANCVGGRRMAPSTRR